MYLSGPVSIIYNTEIDEYQMLWLLYNAEEIQLCTSKHKNSHDWKIFSGHDCR